MRRLLINSKLSHESGGGSSDAPSSVAAPVYSPSGAGSSLSDSYNSPAPADSYGSPVASPVSSRHDTV